MTINERRIKLLKMSTTTQSEWKLYIHKVLELLDLVHFKMSIIEDGNKFICRDRDEEWEEREDPRIIMKLEYFKGIEDFDKNGYIRPKKGGTE